jgi:hypothetical protein
MFSKKDLKSSSDANFKYSLSFFMFSPASSSLILKSSEHPLTNNVTEIKKLNTIL